MSGAPASERGPATERVARAEQQLAIAQQITHIGSWEWDLATSTVRWSDELYRIYGLAPRSREITVDFFLSSVHVDDRPRVQQAVGEALQRGGRFQWVERIVRPDGSVRVLDTVGDVLPGEGGKPRALLGTCRDVTEEQKRDEELRRYADIVKNVQIGLAVFSVSDPGDVSTVRLVAFNPAAEQVAGFPLESKLNQPIREIIPYAMGGMLETLTLEVARSGRVREAFVSSSRDPARPNRALTLKGFPLPGKGVGVAIEDVTRVISARKLQDAEHRVLEMIAEGAPLAHVLCALILAVEEHSPPAIGAIHLRDADDSGRYPERVAPSLVGDEKDLQVYAAAPILGSDERDLGDFVLYVREERRQGLDDATVLDRAAHVARIAIERRQLEDQLRALSAHVESVREDERTAIAREIHDEFGQTLTALKMDIAWIVRRSVSESVTVSRSALVEKLQTMSKMADEAIQQVRRIASGLRPGVLDDLGLVAAIEWQAQDFETRTGTTCEVVSNVTEVKVERSVATAVFRIFQEALTNVTRHAGAQHVDVELRVGEEFIELVVEDDGKGITADALRSRKSLGLLGIRERAQRLGGSVTVTSGVDRAARGVNALFATPKGTRVALRVPVVEAQP
ncbi:MAG TPA: histidine kinase [Polyangiaceae bacterium]